MMTLPSWRRSGRSKPDRSRSRLLRAMIRYTRLWLTGALFHKWCMTGIPGVTPAWSRFGMSSWPPTTYKTRNRPVYNRSLKQRGSLAIRFDRKSDWRARPPGKRRRQPRYGPHYSDAAIQACLTIQVLFGLPLRQTTGLVAGLVESLLGLVDPDCDVADDSRPCRRQKTLSVAIAGQCRPRPIRAQKVRCTCRWTARAYSTVIKTEGDGEWNAGRHGGVKRRLWRKTHIGLDEHTLEIRAVEVTGSTIGDAPVLPDLLTQPDSAGPGDRRRHGRRGL